MLTPSPSKKPTLRRFGEGLLAVAVVIGAILGAAILYLITTELWLFVHQALQQQ
jgi:uncharacterized membrane protein YgaE (UPF0421/DUF939 family)